MLKYAGAFLIGICLLQIWPNIALAKYYYFLTIVIALVYLLTAKLSKFKVYLKLLLLLALGASYVFFIASANLAKRLPSVVLNKPIVVTGIVNEVPILQDDTVKFNFLITKWHDLPDYYRLKPVLVKLTWQKKSALKYGQQWRLTIKLKQPRGFSTPGCFDLEKYYFAKAIVAVGRVLTNKVLAAKLLGSQAGANQIQQLINKLREFYTDLITKKLAELQFAGVIAALVTGIQSQITPQHWQVFRDTGTAHLLAISGLHIGFIAGLAFKISSYIWRYLPCCWRLVPAPIVAAIAAIIAAILYALLAGFSVSTQRACVMVSLAMLGLLLRRLLLASDIFGSALFLVLLLDPLVTFNIGFWLSFGAVAWLLYIFTGRTTLNWIQQWLQPSIVLALGLMPLLLASFHSTSLIAPIANFIAIPWVSFWVVPCALCASILYPIAPNFAQYLWRLADLGLQYLWPILIKLQHLPWAVWQPSVINNISLWIALIGSIWLLAPQGFPGRILGLCGYLPLLWPNVPKLLPGELQLNVLDVGQGLAVVIQTATHTLLYDTGPRFGTSIDAGAQVVVPFLQFAGLSHIAQIMVSHADLDHSGGTLALLQRFKGVAILTGDAEKLRKVLLKQSSALANNQIGFSIVKYLNNNNAINTCRVGQNWQWDGVIFKVLGPDDHAIYTTNEQSCVLQIIAPTAKILLTGDLGAATEQLLIKKFSTQLHSTILIVPHHGSKYSSTAKFIKTVAPEYALASVGYLNPYHHPHPTTLKRYYKYGVKFIDTVKCGTISVKFLQQSKTIEPTCYRSIPTKLWDFNDAVN